MQLAPLLTQPENEIRGREMTKIKLLDRHKKKAREGGGKEKLELDIIVEDPYLTLTLPNGINLTVSLPELLAAVKLEKRAERIRRGEAAILARK
jgi:hypothetical protein